MRFKALFQKAAIRLHPELSDLLQKVICIPIDLMRGELTTEDLGSAEELFKNQNRICTYVVRIPLNGKIYIAIT